MPAPGAVERTTTVENHAQVRRTDRIQDGIDHGFRDTTVTEILLRLERGRGQAYDSVTRLAELGP